MICGAEWSSAAETVKGTLLLLLLLLLLGRGVQMAGCWSVWSEGGVCMQLQLNCCRFVTQLWQCVQALQALRAPCSHLRFQAIV
jgi:hypothetical protein